MRLHLLLPKVDPKALAVPSKCAYPDCTSLQVRLHQPVSKALRDTVHRQVEVHRYRTLRMQKDLPGLSAWSQPGPEFGAGQRAGRDVVPVGTQLWSGVAGVRQLGSAAFQDTGLRDSASRSCTHPRTQARAGLPRSQNQSLRWGFDECEMCWAMAASGSDRR